MTPSRAHWPFRLSTGVAALLLLDQAVFAGQFLAGSFTALHTHRENATYSGIAVLVAAACAVPLRCSGAGRARGPLWPLGACLGLFGLIAVQIVAGFGRALAVHVPLGVVIISLAVWLAAWSWRYRPAEETEAEAETGTETETAAGAAR